MTDLVLLSRRAVGVLSLAILAVAPAACGGDDDTGAESAATTTTAAAAPLGDCSDRFVEVASRPDVVEAARTGAELPADAEAALDRLDEECGEELDALSDEELAALVARLDPDVVNALDESARKEFERTGESIAG